jgi:phosphoglycolate phosphatase-like HAD superfamily hydrolase
MRQIRYLFIDDGGVMNDNAVRAPQWQALVGEFFAPRLGGEPALWSEANRLQVPALWDRFPALVGNGDSPDFHETFRQYELDWLRVMCEHVGAPMPSSDDDQLTLAREAARYVTGRVRAAFPGAVQALRRLADAGYVLHTASGEVSWELEGYVSGMGVRELFRALYGPDLVNATKSSPAYCETIFGHAEVNPAEALVIDDSPRALGWARAAGAATVLVSADGDYPGAHAVRSLAELPAFLERLAAES